MRVMLTGASGFVGSNLAHVLAGHGVRLLAPSHAELDLCEREAVLGYAEEASPEGIVHSAIWNDPGGLLGDRRRAWRSYVHATRNLIDAANRADAQIVLISTDWVFDGEQAPALEDDPPNPINTYGLLKCACELLVLNLARRGTVARVAGVQGIHRARPQTPRSQDTGFGYLALSVVQALSRGDRFTVWTGPGVNERATPVLATHAAEMVYRALTRERTGVLHCVGGEHADRLGLARAAALAFGLDPGLIDTGPVPVGQSPDGRVPRDTRLQALSTASALDMELPGLADLLAGLREQWREPTPSPGRVPDPTVTTREDEHA
ncbi:MAG TPA: sugar nucleotide-binding protein [Solirubrobacteraceae bacterium]|nr:sugar nucleotide-binding protein [Solirubrobacteraceae bacterium]